MNHLLRCRIFGHNYVARESVTAYTSSHGGNSVSLNVQTYEGEVCTRCGKRTRRLDEDAPGLFIGAAHTVPGRKVKRA